MTARVLVALEDAETAEALLDAAVRLAAYRRAELLGLYIEESAFLDALALPFARTFRDTARGWERAAPAELERAFRLRAEALQRRLEHAAARMQVTWNFSVRRGTPAAQLAEAGRPDDLLVLGAGRRSVWHARPGSTAASLAARGASACLVLRPGITGGVAALFDGDPAVLAAAAEVARTEEARLIVAVLGVSAAAQAERAEAARTWLTAHGLAAEIQMLPAHDPAAACRALAALHPGTAVVTRGAAERWLGDGAGLLNTVPCTWLFLPEAESASARP